MRRLTDEQLGAMRRCLELLHAVGLHASSLYAFTTALDVLIDTPVVAREENLLGWTPEQQANSCLQAELEDHTETLIDFWVEVKAYLPQVAGEDRG